MSNSISLRLADILQRVPNFRGEGSCRVADPDLFYSANPGDIRRAKRVCYDCPVLLECSRYAITNEEWGVWGGLTEEERQKLRNLQKEHRQAVGE